MLAILCAEMLLRSLSALNFPDTLGFLVNFPDTLGFLGEKRQGELVVRAGYIHEIVANFSKNDERASTSTLPYIQAGGMDGWKGLYMAATKPASLAKTFWLYGVGYLSILYLASFLAVYTPIGRTLGVPLHIGFLYLKVGLVVAVCGYSAYRVIGRITEAGRIFEGNRLWVKAAVAVVTLATLYLLLVTPYLALDYGVSYR